MKKRVLAVVLCLAMLIGYVPYFAFTAQASNSLNIYQDGVLATSASLPKNSLSSWRPLSPMAPSTSGRSSSTGITGSISPAAQAPP